MATPASVSFHTLGCKLNFAESSSFVQQFISAGYEVMPFAAGADICVINTCSVTDFADKKCRKAVRKALSRNNECKIVVIGCYAQLKPKEIADIEGVDLVLGAAEKFNLLDYVEELHKAPGKGWIRAGDISAVNNFNGAFSYGDRTRSFLKIQDGCNYHCSFCTIPMARGLSRSDHPENVLKHAREIANKGVKEIVLTGVNTGDYQAENYAFIDLLQSLDRSNVVPRIRISSIEPNLCAQDIIRLVRDSEIIMPHFHMPLQSGSDKILAMMRRRYRSVLYEQRVAQIRKLIPHACIGADVIVGFPGESPHDFSRTRQFLANLAIDYLHVFTYSERPNTIAARLADKVPMEERRQRSAELRALSDRLMRRFYTRHLNTVRDVLFEKGGKHDGLSGYTDNYIKVEVPLSAAVGVNQIAPVALDRIHDSGHVYGRVKNGHLLSASG